jgi:hypothetical protein
MLDIISFVARSLTQNGNDPRTVPGPSLSAQNASEVLGWGKAEMLWILCNCIGALRQYHNTFMDTWTWMVFQ